MPAIYITNLEIEEKERNKLHSFRR